MKTSVEINVQVTPAQRMPCRLLQHLATMQISPLAISLSLRILTEWTWLKEFQCLFHLHLCYHDSLTWCSQDQTKSPQVRSGSPSTWKVLECQVKQVYCWEKGQSKENPVKLVRICSMILGLEEQLFISEWYKGSRIIMKFCFFICKSVWQIPYACTKEGMLSIILTWSL